MIPVTASYMQHLELQKRGGIEDNSKIILPISQQKLCCDHSLEPSQRDGSNDETQNVFMEK